MIATLAGLAIVGIGLLAFGASLGRRAFLVAAAVMGIALLWSQPRPQPSLTETRSSSS